jgi:hypothetical protein
VQVKTVECNQLDDKDDVAGEGSFANSFCSAVARIGQKVLIIFHARFQFLLHLLDTRTVIGSVVRWSVVLPYQFFGAEGLRLATTETKCSSTVQFTRYYVIRTISPGFQFYSLFSQKICYSECTYSSTLTLTRLYWSIGTGFPPGVKQ